VNGGSVAGVIGIAAFVVAMLLSIMVHEWGHYITARRFGMKVTEFFLGFGPRLWSIKRGETEFGIKAIPAGGYCRITGMTPVEPISELDTHRAFYIPPLHTRIPHFAPLLLRSGSSATIHSLRTGPPVHLI
jgi:RIP metalloprotease RseP